MRFYDTKTREVREFKPLNEGVASIYTCGPTVYRSPHIGNMRTYIAADLLRRVLEFEGYEVRQVTNITDVGHMTDEVRDEGEDKMLLAVEDEGLSAEEIAQKYTDEFMRNLAALNIQPSHEYPKATDHIKEMIKLTEELIANGHAYETGGFVYFEIDSFPEYGKLSHNSVENLVAGHRLEELDDRKRKHYDFALWKAAGDRRLMKWESPWGEGFPGWHIECSAMSIKHLGERFDIHTGGSDNIFPHHESEIAQSEGAVGHDVVQYWLHGHHLLAEAETKSATTARKMAKSAQNYYTVDDLVERGYDPLAFRYLVLQARYRGQMNFSFRAMDAAQKGLDALRKQMVEWAAQPPEALSEDAQKLNERFHNAVANDLNLPEALVVVSEVPSAAIAPAEKFQLLRRWDSVLGLDLDREVASESSLPKGALERITAREAARKSSDYEEADKLREELKKMGVEVIDTDQGSRWVLQPSSD